MSKRSDRYHAYLRSPAWQARAAEARRRAGQRCERCGFGGRLDVHHLTYERLGNELASDLEALCRDCHRGAHGAKKKTSQAKKKRRPKKRGDGPSKGPVTRAARS